MILQRLEGALVLGAFFYVCCSRSAPKKPLDGSGLERALVQAKQPALAVAAVKNTAATGDACAYAEVAARAALDADLHGMSATVLEAAPKPCPRQAILDGERAEGLARAGGIEKAESLANELLAASPGNPFAELALAKVAFDRGKVGESFDHAHKAGKNGRGAEADRFMGRANLARGQFKEAEEHFRKLLEVNPNDIEAAFSGAISADKVGNYLRAREGFLQTLRIDPAHIEARKYLVLLTARAGAKDESKHHLEKLARLDATIASQLEQAIEAARKNSKTNQQ